MRPIAAISAALACTLLVTQAFAGITTWSNPRDAGPIAIEARVTVFGTFAQPEGDFGSTASSWAAFARTGAGLGLDFSARYSHDIETGVLLLTEWNSFDSEAFELRLADALRQVGIASEPLEVSATRWHITWGVAKVGYAPKVSGQLRASVDIYGGALYGRSPDFELVAAPPGLRVGLVADSWFGLAAGAGAGLRWRDHLSLGILYLSGAAAQGRSGADSSPFRHPISTLNATIGYTFGH